MPLEVKKIEITKKIGKKIVLNFDNNHELIWSYIVSLEYFLLRNNSLVQCQFCAKEFSKPCWHCSQCTFDICEECAISQGFACPKLVCNAIEDTIYYGNAQLLKNIKILIPMAKLLVISVENSDQPHHGIVVNVIMTFVKYGQLKKMPSN